MTKQNVYVYFVKKKNREKFIFNYLVRLLCNKLENYKTNKENFKSANFTMIIFDTTNHYFSLLIKFNSFK